MSLACISLKLSKNRLSFNKALVIYEIYSSDWVLFGGLKFQLVDFIPYFHKIFLIFHLSILQYTSVCCLLPLDLLFIFATRIN